MPKHSKSYYEAALNLAALELVKAVEDGKGVKRAEKILRDTALKYAYSYTKVISRVL